MSLQVVGSRLQGWIDGKGVFDLTNDDDRLLSGAAAFICTEGSMTTDAVAVSPPLEPVT